MMAFMFEAGKEYETQEGKRVFVSGRTKLVGYECLVCSDGIYRYDRSTHSVDAGRVTGTDCDYSCPQNFKRSDKRSGLSSITSEWIEKVSAIMACALSMQAQGWAWDRPMPRVLRFGEYRNPFHFLNEFDQWFEFQRRRRFEKESTWSILSDMLRDDLERAARYEVKERLDTVWFDPSPVMFDRRSVYIKGDFS